MSFLKKFFVRKEIVAPFLHKFDADIIISMVRVNLLDTIYGNMNDAELPMDTIKRLVPDHLITDIYNLYYHKSIDQKYANITQHNIHKWKLLMGINDSTVKIISNHSAINTALFTIEICKVILSSLMVGKNNSPDSTNIFTSNINNTDCESEDDKDSQPTTTREDDNIIYNISSKMNQAIDSALNRIKEYEELGINDDNIKQFGNNVSDAISNIEGLKSNLKSLSINKQAIKSICKNILNKSVGYFSREYTQKDISILEADHISDISGVEYLHPVFKKLELDNVTTKKRKYFGKVNVYVDVSGSMGSYIVVDGKRITVMDFAKAVVATMLEENLLGDLIPFGSDIKYVEEEPKIGDIVKLTAHCGTSINNVVKHAIKANENAIVITDAQANISYYSSKLFFIGTPGATFDPKGEAEEFKTNKQLWVFNQKGTDIVPYL